MHPAAARGRGVGGRALGFQLGDQADGARRQLRPAGLPSVDGRERHAKTSGQLFLAKPEATAQAAKPGGGRFRAGRLAHAKSLRPARYAPYGSQGDEMSLQSQPTNRERVSAMQAAFG